MSFLVYAGVLVSDNGVNAKVLRIGYDYPCPSLPF